MKLNVGASTTTVHLLATTFRDSPSSRPSRSKPSNEEAAKVAKASSPLLLSATQKDITTFCLSDQYITDTLFQMSSVFLTEQHA
jgi:hypothetical protein